MVHTEPHHHHPGRRHAHDHGPAHDHDAAHDHHGHAHDPAVVVAPGPSLLRMSALDRMAGAAVLSALIWAAAKWAMS